jgi:hypothetical protein
MVLIMQACLATRQFTGNYKHGGPKLRQLEQGLVILWTGCKFGPQWSHTWKPTRFCRLLPIADFCPSLAWRVCAATFQVFHIWIVAGCHADDQLLSAHQTQRHGH